MLDLRINLLGLVNQMTICIAVFCVMVLASSFSTGQEITILHSFSGANGDGTNPEGTLALSGTTLYGSTRMGGSGDRGTIYKIGTDGSGYNVIKSFPDENGLGSMPDKGSLTLSGSFLYGTTLGFDTPGTLYKIGTDGNSYSVLHTFDQFEGDGREVFSDLTLGGSTLYGMTSHGGDHNAGTIFQIGTDGKNYNIIHSFTGGADGDFPMYGPLALSGSTLYGMTLFGGTNDNPGTIFKINTNGSGFSVIHTFGEIGDGKFPWGSVTLIGSTLYGMTSSGGDSNNGTIFKINTDGSGYNVLYSFNGTDGASPFSNLIVSGSSLYGTAAYGGHGGTVFKIDTDGSDFSVLYSFEFDSAPTKGAWPYGSLMLSDSTLFGTTYIGGNSGDGTIFALSIPEPSTLALLSIGIINLLAFRFWRYRWIAANTH